MYIICISWRKSIIFSGCFLDNVCLCCRRSLKFGQSYCCSVRYISLLLLTLLLQEADMNRLSFVIPARFLILVAHFVTVVMITLSREQNIMESLPLNFTPEDYSSKETEFVIALSLSFVMFACEFLGFLSGTTMFVGSQCIFSSITHGIGAIVSAFFILQSSIVLFYWYIFGFCCILPTFTEVLTVLGVHCFHRGLY